MIEGRNCPHGFPGGRIQRHNAASEVVLSWVQVGFFAFMALLYFLTPKGFKADMMFEPIPLLLSFYAPLLLVRLYLAPEDPGFAAVAALTVQLLFIAALFQVFDGLQVIASLALRGLKDTLVPLWLAGFGYWVLGIGGGCLLAFPLDLGALGLWWGMALGLIVTGSLLAWRFARLTALRAAASTLH